MAELNIDNEAAVALTQKIGNVIDRSEISTKESRKKQFFATIFATLGCFLNGGIIGYTGPANPSLMDAKGSDIYGNPYSADLQTISWITGFLSIGAFIGGLLAGPIMERIGRKKMMLWVTSITFLIGYLLIFFAFNNYMIYAGRIVGGMGMAFELATVTVYIVEIATVDMRGILGCFVQGMGSLGIVFTFCIGAVVDWKWLAIANAFWCLPFFVGMWFAPESPRWLLSKGKEYSALRSLEWLRGREDQDAIEREMEKIKRDIALKKNQRVSITQLKDTWKPFLVSLTMMGFVQFSGFNVLVYYTGNIFQMSETSIHPNIASIIVGFVLLISCVLSIMVVGTLDRKVLMVTSIFGMGVCQAVLGYCMYHAEQIRDRMDAKMIANNITDLQSFLMNKTEEERALFVETPPSWLGWLPLVAVLGFLFMGNGGYGTLIWVVTAELLPPKIRSIGNAIIICFSFLAGFFVAKTFVDLIESVRTSGTFWIYSGVCFLGFIFTLVCVPETRGRPIDDIQKDFDKPCGQWTKDVICSCCTRARTNKK